MIGIIAIYIKYCVKIDFILPCLLSSSRRSLFQLSWRRRRQVCLFKRSVARQQHGIGGKLGRKKLPCFFQSVLIWDIYLLTFTISLILMILWFMKLSHFLLFFNCFVSFDAALIRRITCYVFDFARKVVQFRLSSSFVLDERHQHPYSYLCIPARNAGTFSDKLLRDLINRRFYPSLDLPYSREWVWDHVLFVNILSLDFYVEGLLNVTDFTDNLKAKRPTVGRTFSDTLYGSNIVYTVNSIALILIRSDYQTFK